MMLNDDENWQTHSLPLFHTPDSDVVLIQPVPLRRTRSFELPSDLPPFPTKSNLRVKTQSESLQCNWRSQQQQQQQQQQRSSNVQTSKRLSWNEVHIRKYDRIEGDNPSCRSGPPLSIDWKYDPQSFRLSIDVFEQQNTCRRSYTELLLSGEDREQLLMNEWEIPRKAIVAAIASAFKTKSQRNNTVTNLNNVTKLHEAIESAGRKCKRALLFRKRPSMQANEMIQQHLAAQAQRHEIGTAMNHTSEDRTEMVHGSRNRSKVHISTSLRQNDTAKVSEQYAKSKENVAGNGSTFGSPQATRMLGAIPHDHVHQGDMQRMVEQHGRSRSTRDEDSLQPTRQELRSIQEPKSHSTSCDLGLDLSDDKILDAMQLRKLEKTTKLMKNPNSQGRNHPDGHASSRSKHAAKTSSTPATGDSYQIPVASSHTHTQTPHLDMQQITSVVDTTKKQSIEPYEDDNVSVSRLESHSDSCDGGLDLVETAGMNAIQAGGRASSEKKMTKRKKRKKSSRHGKRSISENAQDQIGVGDDAPNRSEIHAPAMTNLKRNVGNTEQHLAARVSTIQEEEQPLNPNLDIEGRGSYRGEQPHGIRSDLGLDSLGGAMMTEKIQTGKINKYKKTPKRKKSSHKEKDT